MATEKLSVAQHHLLAELSTDSNLYGGELLFMFPKIYSSFLKTFWV